MTDRRIKFSDELIAEIRAAFLEVPRITAEGLARRLRERGVDISAETIRNVWNRKSRFGRP